MVVAQCVRMVLERGSRFLPVGPALFALLTGNSAILGAALLVPTRAESFAGAFGLGLGIGFSFAGLLLCLTTLQQRLRYAAIAVSFRDAPLALVTAGVMALALMGFTGLVAE
jgi:electron transport complex protein RnfA